MESESEQIIGLYERHAEDWDRRRERLLFERPWLDRLLALLPPRSSILDIGCGSGEPIPRYLVDRGCNITGIDSSSSLIAICKKRFPDLDWIVEDMRTASLGRRFDGIVAWDSFFHLSPEDQRRMFLTFKRHAAPKAALMFTSGTSYGQAIGEFNGEPLYHGSLDTAEYRSLLDLNGFDVMAHVVEDPVCDRTVWLAQRRE